MKPVDVEAIRAAHIAICLICLIVILGVISFCK